MTSELHVCKLTSLLIFEQYDSKEYILLFQIITQPNVLGIH